MRKIAGAIICLCVLYFFGGWLAVRLNLFDEQKYFAFAGIVGGLASVAGLLSLVRPAITNDDFQRIEVDALKSVTKTSEELRDLEHRRSKTAEEIDHLSIRKKEMELLVKKASLSLFLNEQLGHLQKKIAIFTENNEELKVALLELRDVREKLRALGEEIESDPNAELLWEIIEASKNRKSVLDEAISDLPPITRAVVIVLREIVRTYVGVVRTVLR